MINGFGKASGDGDKVALFGRIYEEGGRELCGMGTAHDSYKDAKGSLCECGGFSDGASDDYLND